MQYNRIIAFSSSWSKTIKIALIVGIQVALLMTLLQPFDTFESKTPFKLVKLLGYGLVTAISILLFHLIEQIWYKKQQYQWRLIDEIISMLAFSILMGSLAYGYHAFIFSDGHFSWISYLNFFRYFALPFLPLVLPLLVFLRYQFGTIFIAEEKVESALIQIKGKNKEDEISLLPTHFLYARALQNYVEIHYLNKEHQVQKKVIRSTLNDLMKQLPHAQQIHRSFLINLSYLRALEGNNRKRTLSLQYVEEKLPISAKYYESLKSVLQNRP